MKRLTVTIDEETALVLDALANRLAAHMGTVSRSLVVRQAIRELAEGQGIDLGTPPPRMRAGKRGESDG